MKTLIKRIIGHAIHPLWATEQGPIAVLTYHSVGSESPGSQPTALFRAQVDWLSRHVADFPVLPLRSALSSSAAIDGTRVLITFDDGYKDNSDVAAPILEEFGLRATFFVATAFIDGDASVTSDFKHYRGLPNMTWEQVSKLAEHGHEVGLHSH